MAIFNKILIIFVSMVIGCSLVACSTDTIVEEENIAVQQSQTIDYQKPGAAVQFYHNYDGYSEVGESEAIQLVFAERYGAGVMTISIEPQDDMRVASNLLSESFDLARSEPSIMDVELSASSEGRHYLNIFATVDDLSGNQHFRAFSLVLEVGDISSVESQKTSAEQLPNGDPIILLPAVETIIQ